MVKVDKIAQIRLFLRDGWTIRRISRELHVSRRVIRQARERAEARPYTRTTPHPAPQLDPHKAWIDQILLEDRSRPHKLRHTAKRIHDRLVGERGFHGNPSTVRRYVARRRRDAGESPQVFVPRAHPPGRDGEVDWGTRPVMIAGELVTAHLFAMRPSYSGLPFVRAYPHERQEAFFDGHQHAFRFYGGVCHRLAYDNLTTAVKKVLKGRTREEQDAFTLFRSHFLFDPFFTMAGEEGAHEKGGVEGLVGYVGRNWFVPTPAFESWEAFNSWLLSKCREERERIISGKKQPISVDFDEEKGLLLPLPTHPFDCCRRLEVRSDSKARVRFETNFYSVPTPFALRGLTLKAYWDKVEIVATDRVIASHARLYGRLETSYEPLHYLALLERKPGLWDHGEPFVAWNLPAVFPELRRRLEAHDPKGLREYLRVVRLIAGAGLYAVTEAVGWALSSGTPHVEAIIERVQRSSCRTTPKAATSVVVPIPDVARYQTLFRWEEADGNQPVAADVPEEAAVAHDGPGL